MLTCSNILGLVRSRGFSDPQKRSSLQSARSLKRSAFGSFSSRSSTQPSSPILPSSPVLPVSAASPGSHLPSRPLDVVVHNLNAEAWGTARAARPISVETLLAHMLAVVARRHIHLHSVAATAFSITLVIDDSLETMAADESMASDQTTQSHAVTKSISNSQDTQNTQNTQNTQTTTPSEKFGSTEKSNKGFRTLVAELVNAVEGVDLRETDFICEENRRNRILGQRRTHEW